MNEIIVAVIGLLGVALTAYLGYRSKQVEREVARRELEFQAAALDFSAFLTEWDGCYADLLDLMQTTPVDRFLILRAWNGHMQPRWTTCCYQMRQGKQQPVSYVHVDLDRDYVERLSQAVQNGMVVIRTDQEPPSLVKSIYEAEGVKSSVWFHIESLAFGRAKAITYCSFASADVDSLDDATLTFCRRIASRLKGVAVVFRHGDLSTPDKN